MTTISSPDVVETLLPSLGYFGGSRLDCLEIDVGFALASLKLQIDGDVPTYLNLRGIEFLGDDGVVDLRDHGCHVAQSSVQKSNKGRKGEALLDRKGIHSDREVGPWWEIRVDRPVPMRKIRIFNRPDGWGSRSRSMVVTATGADSTVAELCRLQSDEVVRRVLATLQRVAGIKLTSPALLNGDTARLIRVGLLAELARAARCGDLTAPARDWVDLIALTDIWSAAEPTDDEWTLLAAYLVTQKLENPGFATSMKTMSLCLNSRARLERLEAEVNGMGRERGLGTLMLSRHGLRAQGVLRQKSKAYMAHLKEVISVLQGAGYEVVTAYGTLLGAVREGRFLAHDDDIDIMYRAKAGDRVSVEAEVRMLRDLFEESGFRAADLLPKHLNMHIVSREKGLVIDAFPTWLQDGLLHMHMEGMAIRGIEPGIMFPASTVSLEGEGLPAPANPGAFLEERYGGGWKLPDPYHDWPWKLRAE